MPSGDEGQYAETIRIEDAERARRVLGNRDRHLRSLREMFAVRAVMRGDVLRIEGQRDAVRRAARVAREVLDALARNPDMDDAEIEAILLGAPSTSPVAEDTTIEVFPPKRRIVPRTPGQAHYVRAVMANDLVFCVGPGGTGKTYLAVAMAVSALKKNRVRKIILTRPAIEAGEKLGFLPGDMRAKVNPYLRPLYDALQDMMSFEQIPRYMERDVIEVAPLAYMRGRTLDNAFIILDEGQNCTRKQMRMFLTRLGPASKSVITGDISQTDLPPSEISGMVEAMHVLRGIQGIAFVRLTQADIVRHRLVQQIVDAYEADASSLAAEKMHPPAGSGGDD